MVTRSLWKRARLPLVVCAIAGVSFAAGRWFFPRAQEAATPTAEEKPALVPTCRIELLPPEERIRRMNAPVELPLLYRLNGQRVYPPHRVPIELADNPVLLSQHYATVRFENTTGRPLILYVLGWVEGIGADPLLQNTAIAAAEVRNSAGEVVTDPLLPLGGGWVPPDVPLPETLRFNNPPLFLLRAGSHVDLPMWILGYLRTPREKPGTYTVRAIVSYAEAPSGEKKVITSEPVTITVTEKHIKSAEAYWKAHLAARE